MSTFHIRHDFHPVVGREALLLLQAMGETNEAEFLGRARAHDFELGRRQSATKILASLHDLGLAERPYSARRELIRLTSLGLRMAELAVRNELLLAEFIHLRYWCLYQPGYGGPPFAWAYQTVAGALWEDAPTSIDNDRLVAMVLALAEQQFLLKGVSFSSSSVLGVLHWVRALRPPCVSEGQFQRRPACPPEILVLALEGIHASTGRPLGIPVRLDVATRNAACRTVLLDIAAFDTVLAQAEETFGLIRRQGDGGEMLFIRESLFPGLIPRQELA